MLPIVAMSPVVVLRPTDVAIQPPIRPAAAVVQPPLRPTAASPSMAVVCAMNGASAEVYVHALVAPVVVPCRPKIDHVPVDNMEDDDPMHLVPSDTDQVARGLGPKAVTVCKPLAFRVSIDTEKEIIHNSSVFESHGLICRFRGFWPSLPQLHTWISQS
ncbi:hypothetical protein SUGI_1083180 [Cryptomeria japonica]|nr:hypothetical protein SUGI_1083180 [Cryptomeria japonica]